MESLGRALAAVSVAILLGGMLAGCTTWKAFIGLTNSWSRPADCDKSLIYDNVPTPALVQTALAEGVQQLAIRIPESRAYLMAGVEHLEVLLADEKITYIEVAQAIAEHVSWMNRYYGTEALRVASLVSFLNKSIPLYPCDLKWLKEAVAKQRAAIEQPG